MVEHEFSLYVTVAGGMDFRAMLMRKKKPAKKVVEKVEWIEEPVDRTIKMGTCDEVHFTCKLSVKGKKAKWYIKNQECYKGPKYSMDTDEENGTYTLTIKNPKMEDAGRYTCTVRECNDLSCKGYLEVEPADPEYGIAKGLMDLKGKTKRKVNFKCKVDNPEAKVKWYHNGKEGKPSDTRFLIKNVDGNCSLEIREAEMSDAGEWTCKIDGEFAKEGKDTTSCKLEMSEFQHAFTSQLQGKNVVEGETAVFEIGVEEDDAPAKWYKDGVEIVPDGKRIQIVTEGKKRKLIIKDCKIDDTANITVKVPGDESSAPLKVARGGREAVRPGDHRGRTRWQAVEDGQGRQHDPPRRQAPAGPDQPNQGEVRQVQGDHEECSRNLREVHRHQHHGQADPTQDLQGDGRVLRQSDSSLERTRG